MTQPSFPPEPPPGRPVGPPPREPFGSPPAPGATWQPPAQTAAYAGTMTEPPPVMDRRGVLYHQLLRAGRDGAWWRGLLGLLCLAVGMVVVLPLLVMVPFVAYFVATGQDVANSAIALLDLENPTPAGLAYLNVTLAGLIPLTWLLIRYLHGLRPRWLSSVRPRVRWGYLLVCVGLAVLALIATVAVSAVIPEQASGSVGGEVNEFTPTMRSFLLVVLLLTPLQAAAEEYAFRGYLTQAFGGILGDLGDRTRLRFLRHPAFAVGLASFLFALAHGAQDAPIFFDRFAFGVVAGTLVILTGGLEAGIAMHVLNNWLAFAVALLFGDMGSALNPSGGTWWSIPVTLTQSLTYLALAWWVARRMGLTTRTDPAVLAEPRPRV